MKTISKGDAEELSKGAVDILIESINKLLSEKEFVVLGIPGGRSVEGVFSLLKNERRIPWAKVQIFMVDERLVPLENEDSNFRQANNLFISHLMEEGVLPGENVHPFVVKDTSDAGLSDYENELKRYGDAYDIALLSSGEDCHVGSLFPNHDSIKDGSEFFVHVLDAPKSPPERMTISRKMILRSKAVIILFLGEDKRDAYHEFLDDGDIYSCPARLVKLIKNSYIVTDQE